MWQGWYLYTLARLEVETITLSIVSTGSHYAFLNFALIGANRLPGLPVRAELFPGGSAASAQPYLGVLLLK